MLVVFCYDEVEHGRDWENVKPRMADQTAIERIEKQIRSDKRHRNKLEKAGWTVISLWNGDVISDVSAAADTVEKLFRTKRPDFESSIQQVRSSDENTKLVVNMFDEIGEYSLLNPKDLEILFGKVERWEDHKECRVWVNKDKSFVFVHPKDKNYFFKLPIDGLVLTKGAYWIFQNEVLKKLDLPKDVQRYLSDVLFEKETDISILTKDDIKYGEIVALSGDVEKWKAITMDVVIPEDKAVENVERPVRPVQKAKESGINCAEIDKIFAKDGSYFSMNPSVIQVIFNKSFDSRTESVDVFLSLDSTQRKLRCYFKGRLLFGIVKLDNFSYSDDTFFFRDGNKTYPLFLSRREYNYFKKLIPLLNKEMNHQIPELVIIKNKEEALSYALDCSDVPKEVDGDISKSFSKINSGDNIKATQNSSATTGIQDMSQKSDKKKKILTIVALCLAVIGIISLAVSVTGKNNTRSSKYNNTYSSTDSSEKKYILERLEGNWRGSTKIKNSVYDEEMEFLLYLASSDQTYVAQYIPFPDNSSKFTFCGTFKATTNEIILYDANESIFCQYSWNRTNDGLILKEISGFFTGTTWSLKENDVFMETIDPIANVETLKKKLLENNIVGEAETGIKSASEQKMSEEVATSSQTTEQSTLAEQQGQSSQQSTEQKYLASSKSNKYHSPGCRYAKKIENDNLIIFSSKEEAQKNGYSPCNVCHP